VHYVVPGGALSEDRSTWLPSAPGFFLPERPLAALYRGKFYDAMRRAGLLNQIDPAVWRQRWVVDTVPVGDGRESLQYLAPYVFRVAISDRRIVSCDDGKVVFSYRRSGCRRWRKMTLDALEFLRRFLQHVLPNGLQKVRYYGFLSPNSSASLAGLQWLIALQQGLHFYLRAAAQTSGEARPPIRCAACGGPLRVTAFLPPQPIVFDTS
jgi:hypothetical protein